MRASRRFSCRSILELGEEIDHRFVARIGVLNLTGLAGRMRFWLARAPKKEAASAADKWIVHDKRPSEGAVA
jgi:hypothetical protein